MRPYKEKRTNVQEIFNELCIMTVACLIFVLTNLDQDYQTKMQVSWAIVCIVMGAVILNLLVIFVLVIGKLRDWILKIWKDRALKKYTIDADNFDELKSRDSAITEISGAVTPAK